MLEKLIANYYQGMQHHDLLVVVYDLEGKIQFATDKFAEKFGVYYLSDSLSKEIDGTFGINYLRDNLRKNIYEQVAVMQPEIYKIWQNIRLKVIENKKAFRYLMNVKMHIGIKCFNVMHRPIFSPNGEVIGTEVIGLEYCAFPYAKLIEDQPGQVLSSENINLTLRQKQILFYLIIGYSQQAIADFLGIKRGTIAKLIAEEICPKFKLPGGSATQLVKTILKYDFKYIIPEGIQLVPKIVLL